MDEEFLRNAIFSTLLILGALALALLLVLLISRVISSLLYKKFIPYIKERNLGQVVREEGMETHLKKAGTPTMGGVIFVGVFIILGIAFSILLDFRDMFASRLYECYCIITFVFFGALIGYNDDIKKILRKNTEGLKAIFKFLLQILIALLFIICFFYIKYKIFGYANNDLEAGHTLYIPFIKYFGIDSIDLPNGIFIDILFILLNIFILVGVSNGTNFTDGIDSLLANVTIVVSIYLCIESVSAIRLDLAFLNIIMCGALFGFRKYNKFPAKIFMGDTGSLAIGAYVGAMAYALNIQLKLPIFGFIYMIEVLSVILQVSYFKITHGKRIFKMAPIHHHFEKCGMSEIQVVKMFTYITIILCVISLFI